MKRLRVISIILCAVLMHLGTPSRAQFREKAFTQNYNEHADSVATTDTTDKMLDFKEIFGGLAHKRTMRIGSMFGTSMVLPGTAQIYNEQYWKLPIFYGGIGAGIAGGVIFNKRYQSSALERDRTISTLSFVGAGLFYYASLMDGVVSYRADRSPHPGRATLYSILCPGLGQAYNGEYWKIPIYIGGLVGSVFALTMNNKNYVRFRNIYREATDTEVQYTGPITADQAKYYRDEFRRYRDYSILAVGLVYLLQVIDANVFCYMRDFEVTDDVSMSLEPAIIAPDNALCSNFQSSSVGVSPGMRFAFRF